MAVMPAPRSWLRRLRPADRAAFGLLVGLALLGPSLVRLAGRTLEPTRSVAAAWVEAGLGERDTMGRGRAPSTPPGALDPWGRPFRWETSTMTIVGVDACETLESYYAVSDGPSRDDRTDDVPVEVEEFPWEARPAWARWMTAWPAVPALSILVWLACAWRALRARRRRALPIEAALAIAAASPSAAIARAVTNAEQAPSLGVSAPPLVSGSWAITLTSCGVALVAVLAVRLLSRPPEHR